MLRTPCLALMTPCLASTTSCFASTTSCFASFVDVLRAFRSRSGWFLLCDARRRALLRHAKYAASDEVSQFPCFLFVFAFAPSLSLGGGPCLSMPFLVPFSQGDHRAQQVPGLRLRAFAFVRCAFFYLLFLALQAQQPKIFARFALLFAPRAINSTPGGRGAPPFVLADVRREVRKRPPHAV